MAEIVKVVLSGQDQIDQLNADCARLRALLGEAKGAIALARHETISYTAKAELADLAARIEKELEEK